jgi:hypothetical protein
MSSMGDVFKPGETVPHSGIYLVIHDARHVHSHEVTCVFGERFPPCNHCGHHPRFHLARAAFHVLTHEEFKT